MRVQRSSCGAAATVEGEGAGELLAAIEDFGAGVGEAFTVGDAFGEGDTVGVGVAFAVDPVDVFELSGFDLFVLFGDALAGELSRRAAFLFPEVDGVPRLFVFEFALPRESTLPGRVKSRGRFEAILGVPPATATTTSSLLPRCSTCAVDPGCSRNESSVLSPVRCDLTSANPRPRTAYRKRVFTGGCATVRQPSTVAMT